MLFHTHSPFHGFLFPSLLFLTNTIPFAAALYVVDGSNCTTVCSSGPGDSTTNATDISCHDADYNTTTTGMAFQQCVSCELRSEAIDAHTGQTDLGFALYNLRYAVDQCFFNQSNAASPSPATPCVEQCAPIKDQLEINLLRPSEPVAYEYCTSSFVQEAQQCAKCYSSASSKQIYLANFLNTLATACQPLKTPFPVPSSEIFTLQPPHNLTDDGDGGGGGGGGSGLSHNAKVALAIAIPVIAFLILSLGLVMLFVHCSTRRRRSKRPNKHRSAHNLKRFSSSTPSPQAARHFHPSRQTGHSRNNSDDSRQIRVTSPESRRTPDKIPLPRPLRAAHSPTPFQEPEKLLYPGEHPARDARFGFSKRVDLQVPNPSPNTGKSVDENYVPEAEESSRRLRRTRTRFPVHPALHPAFRNPPDLLTPEPDVDERRLVPRAVSTRAPGSSRDPRHHPPTSSFSRPRSHQPHLKPSTEDIYFTARETSTDSRLLTGSPFNAPSLTTLAETGKSETVSVATRNKHGHTPSDVSQSSRPAPTKSAAGQHSADSRELELPIAENPQVEQVNDPALQRAISTVSRLKAASTQAQSVLDTREVVKDPALSRALAPSPPLMAVQPLRMTKTTTTMTSVDVRASPPLREEVNDPALARALTVTSTRKIHVTEPSPTEPQVPMAFQGPEKVNDPALSRAMPQSSASERLSAYSALQNRAPSPAPVMSATGGLPSTSDLIRQASQNRAVQKQREHRGSDVSPRTTPAPPSSSSQKLQRENSSGSTRSKISSSSTKPSGGFSQKGRPKTPVSPATIPEDAPTGDFGLGRRPTSPISPGTIPSNKHLERVTEELPRPLHGRPSTPISPGTIPTQPPQGRPSTPISPGTIPTYLAPRRQDRPSTPISPGTRPSQPPPPPPQIRHRPSTPISPGTVPISSLNPAVSSTAHRRPTSPISPTTVPVAQATTSSTTATLLDPNRTNLAQNRKRLRPETPISPKTLPQPHHHQDPIQRTRSIESSFMLDMSSTTTTTTTSGSFSATGSPNLTHNLNPDHDPDLTRPEDLPPSEAASVSSWGTFGAPLQQMRSQIRGIGVVRPGEFTRNRRTNSRGKRLGEQIYSVKWKGEVRLQEELEEGEGEEEVEQPEQSGTTPFPPTFSTPPPPTASTATDAGGGGRAGRRGGSVV